MDRLPAEIIYHIARYLDPLDIVTLQLVNRRLLTVARDDNLWRDQSFERSTFLKNHLRRQELIRSDPAEDSRFRALQRALATGNGLNQSRNALAPVEEQGMAAKANERLRLMANWDPSYPSERVDWFSEYIRREGPISISWLQQPRNRDSLDKELMEVRGVGLYHPPSEDQGTHVVAPLDDGSVCVWDIKGLTGRKGSIVGRSASGTLSKRGLDGSVGEGRSEMINTGVTECVSVDSFNRKAYVAVQSTLVEVDLETLQAISHEKFPFSISALSEARLPVPITVGTSLSLHLYDPRAGANAFSDDQHTTLDMLNQPIDPSPHDFRSLLNPIPRANYAPLYQPGPLSILHLSSAGENWNGNGDIYVAGRFPSIMNYDRRFFPRLRGTIYSGARLSSLAGLPHPFVSMDKDLMRRGELSIDQVHKSKELPGQTIVAAGEYNSKGSLEMYGLSPVPELSNISTDSSAGKLQSSTLKNRQTCSSSKLLSVSNHGTSIVFSDGGGHLTWFERDGVTEIRRCNIASNTEEAPRGIWRSLADEDFEQGDIVRKIVNTGRGESQAVNDDDLVLWTGDKLGLLGYSSKPGFTAESFEEKAQSLEKLHREREERVYGDRMRRLLERQADEARFIQGLSFDMGLNRP